MYLMLTMFVAFSRDTTSLVFTYVNLDYSFEVCFDLKIFTSQKITQSAMTAPLS